MGIVLQEEAEVSNCCDMGKQSQLLLKPTEVELGLQVGVEFDNSTGKYDCK